MYELTKREEQVLISAWQLRESAYLVSLRKHLLRTTGKNWSIGSIHKPLLILEEKGFLESHAGESTPKRGGRSKKIYSVTRKGLAALTHCKNVHDSLWSDFVGAEQDR